MNLLAGTSGTGTSPEPEFPPCGGQEEQFVAADTFVTVATASNAEIVDFVLTHGEEPDLAA